LENWCKYLRIILCNRSVQYQRPHLFTTAIFTTEQLRRVVYRAYTVARYRGGSRICLGSSTGRQGVWGWKSPSGV